MQLNPDLEFIRQVKAAGGDTLKQCYQCATCSVTCNLSSCDQPFPRKEMIQAQWGMKEQLLASPSVWLCHQCNDCSTRCPRQARPGDVLAAIRAYAFRHYATPGFMGKALASPSALPLLFLLPLIILLGVLFIGNNGNDLSYLFASSGEVDYAKAFPHGILEMIFIGGNILIFAFAAAGLMRFWKNLNRHAPGVQVAFIPSVIATILEIIPHKKFSSCGEEKSRLWGHLLMFYGFIGAMATAGLALFATIILKELGSPFYLESPINLPNPIKILGVASGAAMLIGGIMMISNRMKTRENIGSGGYPDWLFLIVIFIVGLTGMLSWALRLAEIPVVAYAIYYIHLVVVFFLLWYAPYSKFAHMFYRTLALVWAKGAGQDKPRKSQAA